ncbi:hypothetical protein ACR6C2_07710 [Streptomyces sp. INA 01156]
MPQSETVQLCDDSGPFLRRYVFLNGAGTYEDVALDGQTPHVVTGTVGVCDTIEPCEAQTTRPRRSACASRTARRSPSSSPGTARHDDAGRMAQPHHGRIQRRGPASRDDGVRQPPLHQHHGNVLRRRPGQR